jgi:LysM repeat protein
LKIGQKLQIPAPTASAVSPTVTNGADTGEETYTVKSGDTLTKIAKHYGVSFKAIETENNLSTTKIKVGQKLKIPAKTEAAAPAPTASEPAPVPVGPGPQPSTTSTN